MTTWWIAEQWQAGNVAGSRRLGTVEADGPNNALDAARIKWPNAERLVAAELRQ
jgi:hypothetical protein